MSEILNQVEGPFGEYNFSVSRVLGIVTNVLIGIALAAALIASIISGIKYVMSEGDSKAIAGAKSYLTAAITALFIALVAVSLRAIIVRMLGGTDYGSSI